jgi:gliding motility-associated-like protein
MPKRFLTLALLCAVCSSDAYAQCQNVALGKPVTATPGIYAGQLASYAVDGSCSSGWNSGGYAPKFIQVDLQGQFTVNNINVMFDMSPNGNVNHEIRVSPDMVSWTLVDNITGFYTTGQLIERCYSAAPLTNVRGVRINSLASPSWIAIREFGVYTLSSPTVPTITASGPLNFCQGGSVTLTSSAAPSYQWSSGATTQSITVNASGTYTVTTSEALACVQGTTACTSCSSASASATVTVNPLPVIAISPASSVICNGASVALTASGANTYSWTPATGLSATTGATVTAGPASTATFTVTGTDANTCVATQDVTVTVLPIPTSQSMVNICDTEPYQLPDGSFVTVSGSYQSVLLSAANCDSIVTTVVNAIDCTPDVGCDLICNTDFEDTQVTAPGSYTLVNEAAIPCWSTTATDQMIEVWGTGFNGVPAYSGNQFLELNANMVSTLYQDFQAMPGSTVEVSFAHRGRSGVDVLSVSIGPPGGPYVDAGTYSTGSAAWQYYTVNYTFPAIAQVDYRLRFNSISAAGGNAAAGNFLDAISITLPSMDVTAQPTHPGCPQAQDGEVTLNISGGLPPYQVVWAAPITSDSLQATGLGAGSYSYIVTDTYGCEDTDTVLLAEQFTAEATDVQVAVCDGEAVLLPGGATVMDAGTYVDILQTINGCDSVVTTEVTLLPVHAIALDPVICEGESHLLPGGNTVSVSGVYVDTLLNSFGCDSIITTQLTVNPSPVIDLDVSVCLGQGHFAQGAEQFVAGTYYDTLTTHLGCDSVLITQLTIEPLITFTVDTAVCPDDSVFTGGNWKSQPGTYTDTLQTPEGCDSVLTTVLAHHPSPVAAIDANDVCLDELLTIGDTSTLSSGSIEGWQWDLGNGSSSTQQQPPPQTYDSAGFYMIGLTVWTDNGCTDTAETSIVVSPLPNMDFSADSVCLGVPTVFNDHSTVDQGNITGWEWSIDGSVSNDPDPEHTYTAHGTFDVSLTVFTDIGCSGEMTTDVTVHPLPEPVFTSGSVCQGLETSFTNTSTISSGAIATYQWDFGDQASSAQFDPAHTYSAAGIYTATLTAVSDEGCEAMVAEDVEVYPLPEVNFSISPQSGCEPLSASFTDQSTIAAGYNLGNWQWDFGDGNIARDPVHTNNFLNAGTYDVTLTVTSANGCITSATQANAVTVHPMPEPLFFASPQPTDMFDPNIAFTDSSVVSNGSIVSWHWSFGDGMDTLDQHPTHTYLSEGTYPVQLTVQTDQGCENTFDDEMSIQPVFTIYVPNAFTPNEDGTNEVFRAYGEGIRTYELLVFNRWGEQIFASYSIGHGWNGLKNNAGLASPQGIYSYKITLTSIFSTTVYQYKGFVSLTR